jgi:acetyl esterase/lipase
VGVPAVRASHCSLVHNATALECAHVHAIFTAGDSSGTLLRIASATRLADGCWPRVLAVFWLCPTVLCSSNVPKMDFFEFRRSRWGTTQFCSAEHTPTKKHQLESAQSLRRMIAERRGRRPQWFRLTTHTVCTSSYSSYRQSTTRPEISQRLIRIAHFFPKRTELPLN